MAKQSNYCSRSCEERIDFILSNYGQMDQLIKAKTESLVYVISNQRAYNRKKGADELGVRIQTSRVFRSMTEEEAIERIMLNESIENGEISEDLKEGIDNIEEINEAIFDIRLLKNEYRLIECHVNSLSLESKRIIVPYLKKETDAKKLAKQLCIEETSVKQRTYRIRKQIKEMVLPFLEEYRGEGM